MNLQFYEKNGYIAPSLNELYDVVKQDYWDCISWYADAFILCSNRHPMPVHDAIFPKFVKPLDFKDLESRAKKVLEKTGERIVIYVTGLSSALIAAVNVCLELNKKLILMHYDPNNAHYYPQPVYTIKEC